MELLWTDINVLQNTKVRNVVEIRTIMSHLSNILADYGYVRVCILTCIWLNFPNLVSIMFLAVGHFLPHLVI